MSKVIDLCLSGVFFQALKYAKTRFLSGLCPGPTGGAYDAPPVPLVGWGEDTPFPSSLNAFGTLVVWPPTSLKLVQLALRSKRLDTPAVYDWPGKSLEAYLYNDYDNDVPKW